MSVLGTISEGCNNYCYSVFITTWQHGNMATSQHGKHVRIRVLLFGTIRNKKRHPQLRLRLVLWISTICGMLETHYVGGMLKKHDVGGMSETHNVGGMLETHDVGRMLETHDVGGMLKKHDVGGMLETHDVDGMLIETWRRWECWRNMT